MCAPQRLFDFVTTPSNWVGTHPATKGVRGNTASPKGLGERWFELVEPPGGRRFEAEWSVVKADPPMLWQIRADKLAGLPAAATITYMIDERVGEGLANARRGSHFRRDMVFSLPDDFQVSDSLRATLTSRETHDLYLKAVKERLEGTE